ncbi:hypothetical protein Bca4012_024499 [Brassica carinata]|uniref:Uncharacterized protein n=1 Tax=Brassica carinata TaxID=52824 RepID=A0A8X7VF46_BRACI|nr:hypothetical protein Bca52824_021566 [Brassica carinata]
MSYLAADRCGSKGFTSFGIKLTQNLEKADTRTEGQKFTLQQVYGTTAAAGASQVTSEQPLGIVSFDILPMDIRATKWAVEPNCKECSWVASVLQQKSSSLD